VGAKSIHRLKVRAKARVVNLEKMGAEKSAFEEQQWLSIT
jgi:hypothetical protein